MAPGEAERRVLIHRVNEIDHWFRPAERHKIGQFATQLMVAIPLASDERHEEEDLEAIAELYVTALEKFPFFAIKAAFEAALRGKVGATGGRFRPTPPEMALACERELHFFAKERRAIRDILEAQIAEQRPESPRRAELADSAKRVLAELAAARPPNEIARGMTSGTVKVDHGLSPKERAEKRLEGLRAMPLPQLSDQALARAFRAPEPLPCDKE